MKINYSDKNLKDFFESLDKDFLKKVYEDAIPSNKEPRKDLSLKATKL